MILKFLKPFSFLPALILMYMIFFFSAQDGATSADLSYQVSYKIVEVGGDLLGADLQPWEVDQLAMRFHIPVRKLAHMTEYFLLAIAVAFPLYVYGLRGVLLLICAGMICVASPGVRGRTRPVQTRRSDRFRRRIFRHRPRAHHRLDRAQHDLPPVRPQEETRDRRGGRSLYERSA